MNKAFHPLDQNDCTLKTSRVDIWQFPLDRPASIAEYALLSEDEQTRAKQFHFERHRRRFTAARATLRRIIARYLSLPAETLVFEYNPEGKPSLKQPLLKQEPVCLQFNLSHSGELALLAIAQTHPVGIDLEYFSARPYAGIGRHMFSTEENTALHTLRPGLQPLAFFHIWSQKEAFIKAIGRGLSYPTQQITLPALPPRHQDIIDPIQNNLWHLIAFMPEPTCCAALCHHPSIQDIRFTSQALR